MALQVVHAMQFLHKKRLLHRDLATRNCVVDQQLKVQVADNALSRDLFPADYHCLGDNENRPVKWLAIESLVHGNFSTASDVVSAPSVVNKLFICFNFPSSLIPTVAVLMLEVRVTLAAHIVGS
jgi:serine/threonine protein kinase